ncbi:MAG: alanine racemase [Flavobacteriales bacterium]|jgi:diaminopimelate decarboxylase|nr:alanine racemase [Flavobacteriales bacterium]
MTNNFDFQLAKELEQKFGDSFYLFHSDVFKKNYDDFLGAFRKYYPNTHIGYSYKTNYTPKICKIVDQRGGYAEVVSEMEYDLALKVGVQKNRIIVNGPYKNKEALEKFLLSGSLVNIDSYKELENLFMIAQEQPKSTLNIGLRCNFEINSDLISRFGFDITQAKFFQIFEELKNHQNIKLKGLHCHFPNRDLASYIPRVESMLDLVQKVFPTNPPEFIDIGGGYFGKMHEDLKKQFNANVPSYQEYAKEIATRIGEHFTHIEDDKKPKLFLEPGSALVANTMQFVAKVIDIKQVRGQDIAMTSGSRFNIGVISSTVNMPMKVLSDDSDTPSFENLNISGYTCIESDYLFRGYSGPMTIGDYLAFSNVGSYSVVFKPPFILPNVSIIDINEHGYSEIKRKETMEDIFTTFNF